MMTFDFPPVRLPLQKNKDTCHEEYTVRSNLIVIFLSNRHTRDFVFKLDLGHWDTLNCH